MANEMRDRLIKDLRISKTEWLEKECDHETNKELVEYVADYLIENGVIVPPCKVGDTIYMLVTRHTVSFEWENRKMVRQENQHTIIKKTTFTKSNFFKVIEQFGKTVFLTKSEAEQKLKEMRGE